MPIFKEMNPDDVWKQLEGHENKIGKEMKLVEEYFAKLSCASCGGSCRPIVNPQQMFENNAILPNFLAQCNDCDAQFSPYTKIEVRGSKRNPLEDD